MISFFAKQKRIFLCVFGWPVSRVLSVKMIINLGMTLLPCSSGHGNGRTAHVFHTLHLTEFTANYCHQYFEWALTSLFHHCHFQAVYFCCTFPQVALAWRYQAWLFCGARTFLTARGGAIIQPTMVLYTRLFFASSANLVC